MRWCFVKLMITMVALGVLWPVCALAAPCPRCIEAEHTESEIDSAIARASRYLTRIQHVEGWWQGRFITDASMNSYYVILMHYLRDVDEQRQRKAVHLIERRQSADGGWSLYPRGPSELSVTVVNYFALKLAGFPATDPRLMAARSFILGHGGAEQCNPLDMNLLVYFGQAPWSKHSPLTTDIFLSEDLLYRVGVVRISLVPFAVLHENRHVVELNEQQSVPEIFREDPWRSMPAGSPTAGGCCADEAIEWILARQDVDGTWVGAGTFLHTMVSLMALVSTKDPAHDEAILRGMRGIRTLQIESRDEITQQFATVPVTDTAGALTALLSAGVDPLDPSIEKAVDWLVRVQSTVPGDWIHNNPGGEPGGWSFSFHNQMYPDLDDTALVLNAFAHLDPAGKRRIEESIRKGLLWVFSMQNQDGGWAVWDKNCLEFPRFFADLGVDHLLSDLSAEDVTARTLTAVAALDTSVPDGVIDRAHRFLLDKQTEPGIWYGRWGGGYVYGTAQVIHGLLASGLPSTHPKVRRAINWLKSVQNSDGGWGESPASYEDASLAGAGDSTIQQTAMATLALIEAGEIDTPEASVGIGFILKKQRSDGSWVDDEFGGTVFPGHWYVSYELEETCLSLRALASYQRSTHRSVR